MTEPCIRAAWLELGSLKVALEDYDSGYFCQSLDLGNPAPRDVTANRPDQDGVDDRTRFMGSRTVTAAITALTGAGARIDAVAASFAPFMAPGVRPVLHYVLDRPGAAERIVTLRAADFSWPIVGAFERDIQLQWVAPDPVIYDPAVKTVTAWSGGGGLQGRTYPLTFNRIYPPGSSAPISPDFTSAGDLPAWPVLRVYGPVAGAQVTIGLNWPDGTWAITFIQFRSTFTINAGQWVDVDTKRRTAIANSDPNQNVINQIDWSLTTAWPYILPLPVTCWLRITGSNTSGVTQVQATWRDAYLT